MSGTVTGCALTPSQPMLAMFDVALSVLIFMVQILKGALSLLSHPPYSPSILSILIERNH